MITIWKPTIFTFKLGIPKFSKISFTMAVDRNAVIKLHKSRESNVEIAKRLDMKGSTVRKVVKKFQETGNTLDWSGRERKRSVRSPQLLKNTREKLQRNPRRSCRTFATAAGVSKSTMHQVLRDNLRVKLFKMLHCQDLPSNYVVRGHKKQRVYPGLCDGRPNHDRLRILASGDDPYLCE